MADRATASPARLVAPPAPQETAAVSPRPRTPQNAFAAATATGVVLARQPIFDADLRLHAFELLYRAVGEDGRPVDGGKATATVLVAALADVGLQRLVGDQRAFLNVDREFLLSFRPLPLPADRVVLELVENQLIDDELIAVLAELKHAGFSLALDNFDHRPEYEPLLGLADIAKLDVQALSRQRIAENIACLGEHGIEVIAEKVETREELEQCRKLGIKRFQGFFFERPELVEGRPTPTLRLGAIADLLDAEDDDFDALEAMISHDVGVSHKLLRLANSAHVAPRHQVRSIRHALALIGGRTVRRWTTLLMLAEARGHAHELLVTALIRARCCEVRAERSTGADTDRAFTAGLFSVADALLETPLAEVLEALPFDEAMTAALLEHAGPEGRILKAVVDYEHGRFDEAAGGKDVTGLSDAYYDAVEWATETILQLG
jgi:EAL and modified HD-GYP domain-containing signal transduction protein